MLDLLDKFFDKLMTVGLSVGVVIALLFDPTIQFMQAWKGYKDTVSSHEEVIKNIKVELIEIKSLINDTAGVKSFDVAASLNSLENKFSTLENKNKEVMSILRDDPETLATIREVNVKYDHILKNIDKIENDVNRAEDKMYSDWQSSNTIWWAVAMFLVGLIGPKVLHALFPAKK
ncbi:TPA: hypothetical protein RQK05_004563 [Vibrio vulnificus]|nr:hypothetical protein [Vibrio vulnificus]HDY7749838.1 hypothetical protein [Vibrio vulnificus]HDY7759201.1 hypothetical protein [Vibrio vulnificus]HDY7763809.1 hypothetical protein [Vibrio vulnificus]HDY7772977.1 hypothetical protein [Vibrio vulnificus]